MLFYIRAIRAYGTAAYLLLSQWRGERYDGTSTRTGPLQSKKKLKIKLKDNAKK